MNLKLLDQYLNYWHLIHETLPNELRNQQEQTRRILNNPQHRRDWEDACHYGRKKRLEIKAEMAEFEELMDKWSVWKIRMRHVDEDIRDVYAKLKGMGDWREQGTEEVFKLGNRLEELIGKREEKKRELGELVAWMRKPEDEGGPRARRRR